LEGYIAPPKMKVKGYMYPQMKKPVGMLQLWQKSINWG
jgi:hypothetical protein